MVLILMGCEWTGKKTLSPIIAKWWTEQTGKTAKFHDHFTPPFQVQDNPTTDPRENEQVASLIPSLQEKFQRYQVEYHIRPFVHDDDLLLVNHYYGDAVYAPLYYGYGKAGEYGDRVWLARHWDHVMMEVFPDTVLVLMKASPEVVRQRRAEMPRPACPITEQDVELILDRFDEEFNNSLILRRFTLDTSSASVDETMDEFVQTIEPLLSAKDALRVLRHRALAP
jgi:hypothetical protein